MDQESRGGAEPTANGLRSISGSPAYRLTDGTTILVDPAAVRDVATEKLHRRPLTRIEWLRSRTQDALRSGAWFFVALAGIQLAMILRDLLDRGIPIDPPYLAAVLGGPVVTLLPAAVLLWRPDAWRWNAALIVGAALWSAPQVVIRVLLGAASAAPMDLASAEQTGTAVRAAADLLTLPAGLLMIVGLERARTVTQATWPLPMVLVAVGLALLLCLRLAPALFSYDPYAYGTYDYDPTSTWTLGHVSWWLQTLATDLRPGLTSLWFGGIAWSTLSAVRAAEPPRSLWRILLVASVVLFAAEVLVVDTQVAVDWSASFLPIPTVANAIDVAVTVGEAFLTVGFVVPVLAPEHDS